MLVAPGPTEAVHGERRRAGRGAGVADGGVHHGLLVAALVVAQRRRRSSPATSRSSSAWPTPATLPWPKMPQQPAKNGVLDAVALDVLRLRKRTSAWATVSRTVAHRPLARLPCRCPATGSRGVDVAASAQVSRTQACAGSSQISQARSSPGPAMTLR